METHTTGNYSTDRATLLNTLEADIPRAYVDSEGIATFGIGLNLREHGELLLQALGFDFSGEHLAGEALQREQQFGEQLVNDIFEDDYTVGTYRTNIADNNPAKTAIDAILQERHDHFQGLAYDAANFTSEASYNTFRSSLVEEFEITDENTREELLTSVLDGYTVPDINGDPHDKESYEALVDKWLRETDVGDAQPALWFQDSKERMALLSLDFNSRARDGLPTPLGPSMTSALLKDNRVEAWYEIRYNSSAAGQHAKRRENCPSQPSISVSRRLLRRGLEVFEAY